LEGKSCRALKQFSNFSKDVRQPQGKLTSKEEEIKEDDFE
jgi:hypothetical protein